MSDLSLQLRDRIANATLTAAVSCVLITTVLAMVAAIFFSPGRSLLPFIVSVCGALLAAFLGIRGNPRRGTACLILSLLATLCLAMTVNGGVMSTGYLLSLPIVVLVATVHGPRWAWVCTIAIAALGIGFLYASSVEWIGPPPELRPLFKWIVVSLITGLTAIFAIIPNNLLRRALRDLENSNDDLKQFAYLAAHDLQEPTRMIMLYMQLIQSRAGQHFDEETRDYFKFVLTNTRRMQGMVRSVLDFSHIGADGKNFAPVDVRTVVDHALENLSEAIREAGATVAVGSLPRIVGSEPQLMRLFQNLVSNAVKFHSDRPPRIVISAERASRGWIFQVADNGIGIPAGSGERLFGLFQRMHHQSQYKGDGIGLAVCKKIVSLHDGRIWFEPNPGGGTAFKFFLPDRKEA